jgi:RNA polymerase sigma factor (sigma-70 family)
MVALTTVRLRTADARSDESLWQRAVAGDRDALEKLLTKYRAIFALWVNRVFRGGNRWNEDYAQEATIRVFKKLNKYRPERAAFCTWAHVVGRSAIFSFIKKHASERYDVSLDVLWEDAVATLRGPEEEYAFLRLCEEGEKLESQRYAAVGGHFYEDKADKQIGVEQHMETRRVNYRRHQGLRSMKKGLSEVPFMSIRPKLRFSGYYIVMNHKTGAHASALPGGEEGDCE